MLQACSSVDPVADSETKGTHQLHLPLLTKRREVLLLTLHLTRLGVDLQLKKEATKQNDIDE